VVHVADEVVDVVPQDLGAVPEEEADRIEVIAGVADLVMVLSWDGDVLAGGSGAVRSARREVLYDHVAGRRLVLTNWWGPTLCAYELVGPDPGVIVTPTEP